MLKAGTTQSTQNNNGAHMKKLFAIKDNSINKVLDENFENKQLAKTRRDELNKETKSLFRFTITPGPEHHRY